jgi:hypothetical protein
MVFQTQVPHLTQFHTLQILPISNTSHFSQDSADSGHRSAKTAIGNPIHCFGAFTVKINLTGDGETPRPVTTLIHVLESLQQAVISSASQRELGMLHDGYPHSRENSVTSQGVADPSPAQREAELEAIMAECRKVFDGVCRVMKGPPCHFVLKEGAIPEKFRGSRHVSETLKEPFKE